MGGGGGGGGGGGRFAHAGLLYHYYIYVMSVEYISCTIYTQNPHKPSKPSNPHKPSQIFIKRFESNLYEIDHEKFESSVRFELRCCLMYVLLLETLKNVSNRYFSYQHYSKYR